MRLVRYSQAAEEQDFKGQIIPALLTLKRVPIALTLSEKEVRFVFYEGNSRKNKPDQIVVLKLLNNRYELIEITKGKSEPLPAPRYAERIRGTDITYEDLAMRFLYWPGPKHLGVERAKGGDAWKIRCTNPEKSGAYAVVDVWVSQSSGALMKLHGYNAAGKLVKTFEVKRVQRHEGAWILEKMFVRTHGRRVTSTTLEVESPR